MWNAGKFEKQSTYYIVDIYNHFTCYMHIGFIWVHDILTAGVAIDYEKKITVIYETNISLVCTEFFRPSDYDLEILPSFSHQKMHYI